MAGAYKNGSFSVAHGIGSWEALVLQVGVATGWWVMLGDQRQRQRQLPKLPTAASLEREAPTSINNRCCAHACRPCLSHNVLSLGDVAMAFQVRLRIPLRLLSATRLALTTCFEVEGIRLLRRQPGPARR